MLLIILIVILCLIWYFYKFVYIYHKHLKQYPMPPEVPILGHTLDFLDKNPLEVLMGYVEKYGEIVRVKTGPNRQLLLISNYDLLQFIFTTTKILKKSMDYRFFENWLGTGLVNSNGTKWKTHRRIITPTFHYEILEDFVEVFEKNSKILINKLEKLTDENSVEIYELFNLCTLDIICESAMGTSVNAQQDSNSEYVQSVKTVLDVIMKRCFAPHKHFELLYRFTEDYKREKKALELIHSHTRHVIKTRQEALSHNCTGKKRKAFLDLLLESNQNQLSLEEIREEVDTFMFAGHDTTATAISFTIFCLANYPEIQSKVLQEQQQIFAGNQTRPLTFSDLKNMPYLELVIKESLRLYPPAPFVGRELEQDVPYKDTILPKGLTLTLFLFALHRNSNYVPNPEKFDPERFRGDHGKSPFAFLPFSAGPRNCIGQRFAMLEMKSIISRVVQNFEVLPAIPEHELQLGTQTILMSLNGVRVRFKKRSL